MKITQIIIEVKKEDLCSDCYEKEHCLPGSIYYYSCNHRVNQWQKAQYNFIELCEMLARVRLKREKQNPKDKTWKDLKEKYMEDIKKDLETIFENFPED